MKKTAGVYFFILIFISLVSPTEAQQVNFRNFSVGEGLAQSQVFAVVQDDRGYLWMGTRGGGISLFDGVSFTNFTTRNGLLNDFIFCIHKAKNGNICIGSNHGLTVYDGREFLNYPLGTDSIPLGVNSIAEDKEGKLWLATPRGIYVFHGKKTECFSCNHKVNNKIISCVFFDRNNKLWFGDDYGLNRVDSLKDKGIRVVTYRGKDGFRNVLVRSINQTKDGRFLIGTYGGGAFLFYNGKATPLPWNQEMESRIIHDVLIDSDGNYWFATQDAGIYRVDPVDSILTHYSEREGLANNHVSCIFEDSWGNIWSGTSGGGVSRFSGEQFMHYTEKNGLAGNYIYSVFMDRDSVLWLGTSAKGVIRFFENYSEHINESSGFVNEKVKAIYQDANGNMWFGTEGKGAWKYRKEDSSFVQFTTRDGLSNNWIKDITSDRDGNIWLATAGGGICVLPEGKKENIRVIKDGLTRTRVNCIYIDGEGRIWYGTEGGGAGFFDGEKIKNFSTHNGLSGNIVRAFREDQNGFLWLATGGGGMSRIDIYRSMDIIHITRNNGLSSDNLYLLETDNMNNLWVGSDNGADKIILNEHSEVSEIKHYGKAEGFSGIETCQNAVCRGFDGSIWFGTINGLTRYNPENSIVNSKAPELNLTGVQLFYEPLDKTRFTSHLLSWGRWRDSLVLDHTENHLTFDFIGIDHRNPSSVKYQWKLEGFDNNWSPLSFKNDVTYSNLSPGEYTFLVRAVNEDGVWSQNPGSFYFIIEPPVWQRWWFRLLIAAGMAVVLVLIVWFSFRRIRNRNRRIRERLQTEKKIVELEQKALRLQMNPHFIFHALNSIQGLIVQKDEKTARMYLSKFSKLMRAILENSREQLIPLDKEIQTLTDYLSLEKFTRNNSFDFEICLDKTAEDVVEELMIPSLLLQPFVENSIIHGFSGLERRGMISVSFSVEDNFLLCRVKDNGVGRERATANRMQRDVFHKSMALIVTQERLDLINRETKVHAEHGIKIIDLLDKDNNPGGTLVELRIRV